MRKTPGRGKQGDKSSAKRTRPVRRRPRAALPEAQRAALFDAASEMVRFEGPGALRLRRLGQAIGASTTAVYTYFGGKDALMRALYDEALDRLGRAMARVSEPEPLARLARLALAYREFAVANPGYYRVLELGWHSAGEVRNSRAYQLLVEAIAQLPQLTLPPESASDALWAVVHGYVSLELGGYFPSAEIAAQRLAEGGNALLMAFFGAPATDFAS